MVLMYVLNNAYGFLKLAAFFLQSVRPSFVHLLNKTIICSSLLTRTKQSRNSLLGPLQSAMGLLLLGLKMEFTPGSLLKNLTISRSCFLQQTINKHFVYSFVIWANTYVVIEFCRTSNFPFFVEVLIF
jgi:hypothetical protein